MPGDRRDDSPPTKGGPENVRAVIRPQSDAAIDSTKGPYLPTEAMPVAADLREERDATGKKRTKTTQQSALAMTECPACHVATPVARFCTECGETLVQRNFCSSCGAHLQPMANFCDGCGLKVP